MHTKLEGKLEELKIVPSRYERLAETSRMTITKLRDLVTGKKRINQMEAESIADGIYTILGKKVEVKEIM